MAFMKRKSVLPIYLVGVTWLVWAVFLPLYRPAHYIMAALASAIVYFVGKMIWPDRGYVLKDEPEQAAQPEQAESEPQQPPKGAEKSASTGDPAIDALIAERDRAISFSCSASNPSKSTCSCRFSLAGSVRRSITSPTAPTTFFTPSKVVKP